METEYTYKNNMVLRPIKREMPYVDDHDDEDSYDSENDEDYVDGEYENEDYDEESAKSTETEENVEEVEDDSNVEHIENERKNNCAFCKQLFIVGMLFAYCSGISYVAWRYYTSQY